MVFRFFSINVIWFLNINDHNEFCVLRSARRDACPSKNVELFSANACNCELMNCVIQNWITHTMNSTSFESLRTPSHLRLGVFMRMSQSITNILPLGDFIRFSSCMSLR